jgi:hypothetical protein
MPAILSVFLHNQSIKTIPCFSNPVRISAQSINKTYAVFQQSCPYSCTINQSNLCRVPAILAVFLHNQSIKPMLCSSNPVRILAQSINQTFASNPGRIPAQSINQTYTVFQQSCPYSCSINQSNLCIFQQSCPYSCAVNQSNISRIPAIPSVLSAQSINQINAGFQQSSLYTCPINQLSLYGTMFQQLCLYSRVNHLSNICR